MQNPYQSPKIAPMSQSSAKPANIIIQLENETLSRLLAEQLSGLKNAISNPDLAADCLIIDEGKKQLLSSATPVLELAKGPVILGSIMDQLKYLLSGRESHIEDENETIPLQGLTLYPGRNILIHETSGNTIHLTDKERLLLKILYQAGEAGLAKSELLKSVWGYAEAAETHTLETHIYRLRQKLEPYGANDLIKAVDGNYILNNKKPA